MYTIWKFAKSVADLDDFTRFEMPVGARVLSVGNHDENLCIWAIVNPNAKTETRTFKVIGTGNPLPGDPNSRFIGTVTFRLGLFVVHVFEN